MEAPNSWVWPGRMAQKAYEEGWFDPPYTEKKPIDVDHGAGCRCADCMWEEDVCDAPDTDSMIATWRRVRVD